ncbi:hypothetical protein ESCO_000244 [Escovopsis weberi]|uniref:Uncharacterized protein n=1 Tax=Escovopsis weberi TaxID=150374 RepID=A0A0M9VTJ0_ESCWE|nr:hypothetical protein ESCO_000244 [Escovopsis weberi]
MSSPAKSNPDAEDAVFDEQQEDLDDQDVLEEEFEEELEEDQDEDTARLEFNLDMARTPDLSHVDQNGDTSISPGTPGVLGPFDWDDFEHRYERALEEADEHEKEILKEAEDLSRYFAAWSSAASAHDNERAVKRLQTRQRYVNISEEKLAQKQQHYEEVVRAFESALALLRST